MVDGYSPLSAENEGMQHGRQPKSAGGRSRLAAPPLCRGMVTMCRGGEPAKDRAAASSLISSFTCKAEEMLQCTVAEEVLQCTVAEEAEEMLQCNAVRTHRFRLARGQGTVRERSRPGPGKST